MAVYIGLLRAVNLGPHNKVGMAVAFRAGPHAYIVYPNGIGRSRLTTALIEKYFGTRGTGRNWNTVIKRGALARIG